MNCRPAPSLPSPVLDYLQRLHRECAGMTDGKVATYIPELAKADPNWFGICLVTATGAVYEVGDTGQPFTIQSISKPFVYGLALEDCGRSAVLQKVGVEPTGDAFNSISLEPGTGRPRNPMINAGAIATAGLIAGRADTRPKRLLEMFGAYAGRTLTFDETVYRSESETGHRNRAIGHMLRNFDILTSDPMPVAELYFKQCSISVTCRDMAVMAATLANQGVNPVTGKQAIRGEYVESVLSVMETCGMYDFAGEWLYKVGMPAKSGVSGGIIAVLPGQLGIGVFSPPLDARGNSVRGIRVCEELSRRFDLHLLNRPGVGRFTIRLKFTGADFNSSRVRNEEERRVLRENGRRIRVWQLQGNLTFSTAEVVARDVVESLADFDYALLDLKRVLGIHECACSMFHQLLLDLGAQGKSLLFAHADRVKVLQRFMRIKLGDRFEATFRSFDDTDRALEWCENKLLQPAPPSERRIGPETFALFAGLTVAELEVMGTLLKRRTFAAGATIIDVGAEAAEMFLLARGTVSVQVALASGARKRLATFSPGMAFGEMAVIDRAPRSATITADTEAECDVLRLDDFDRLDQTHPALKLKLWRNLCLDLCGKLRKANRELSVFD
ncbi:MAG: glutaminase A [Verrucomicrobia bacterium]|nr:glutaminase A [Verrucomicrobiota bacterium]